MSHVQAKVFRILYVSCVVCAGKFLPFKSMLHVLIYNFICAGQPRHRMCRPNSNFVCAGKFFLSNVACADCLENTVICSGQNIFCASVLSSEPGLSKTLSRAASFAGASILRLHLHLTRVTKIPSCGGGPAAAPGPAPGPAPGASACCSFACYGRGGLRRSSGGASGGCGARAKH